MRLFLGRSKSSTMAAAPLQASPVGKAIPAKESAVGDVERKAEEPIGSGVTALRLEPSPEYITTTHGILTALETLGAAAVMELYLLMGHSMTYQWYVHAVFLLAFTYCLNNTLVFISGVASPSTQNHLKQTLYYSLYHCTAGLLFLVGCAVFYGVDRRYSLRFRNITGTALLGSGILHACYGLNTLQRALP